jgi:hypothetical protein
VEVEAGVAAVADLVVLEEEAVVVVVPVEDGRRIINNYELK